MVKVGGDALPVGGGGGGEFVYKKLYYIQSIAVHREFMDLILFHDVD